MMTELGPKSEHGLATIGEMMGKTFEEGMRAHATSGKFGADIARMALDYSFSDSWGREGLSRREKSLVVIGALIALRQTAELRNHVKIGVANGLSVSDLESALVQACSYVGFPAIATATTAVIQALREAGLDPDAKTAEERGLL